MKLADFITSERVNSIPAGVVSGVLSGSIRAGELALLTEAGQFRRAEPRLPLTALNNTTLGASPLFAPVGMEGGGSLTPSVPVRLTGGNVVVPAAQNSATAFIRAPSGTVVAKVAPGWVSSPTCQVQIVALSNGNFLVAGLSGASMKGRIYTPNGDAVTADLTFSAADIYYSNTTEQYFATCSTLGGGFAVAFGTPGTTNLTVRFYDNAGVFKTAFTSPTGGAPDATSMRYMLVSCANGDVLLHTHRVGSGLLSRITQAGTRTYGPVNFAGNGTNMPGPTATSNAFLPDQATTILELANGNVAIILTNVSGAADVFLVNGSTGALIKILALGTAPVTAMPALCKVPVGFAAVTSASTTSTSLSLFDNDGNVLMSQAIVETGQNDGVSQVTYSAAWVGTGIAVNRCSLNGTTKEGRLMLVDLNAALVGAPIIYSTGSPTFRTGGMIGGEDGIVYFSFTNGSPSYAAYKCARCSLFGVAQADGANGETVTFKALGSFVLPASQVFPNPAAFDVRTNAVPGTRGVVGANRAALFGLV